MAYGDDYAGVMYSFTSDGNRDYGNRSTWAKAHVIMNNTYMNNYSYSNTNKHKTTIHELGHALSLNHQYSPTISIMKQGKFEYSDPQPVDIANLQWKY